MEPGPSGLSPRHSGQSCLLSGPLQSYGATQSRARVTRTRDSFLSDRRGCGLRCEVGSWAPEGPDQGRAEKPGWPAAGAALMAPVGLWTPDPPGLQQDQAAHTQGCRAHLQPLCTSVNSMHTVATHSNCHCAHLWPLCTRVHPQPLHTSRWREHPFFMCLQFCTKTPTAPPVPCHHASNTIPQLMCGRRQRHGGPPPAWPYSRQPPSLEPAWQQLPCEHPGLHHEYWTLKCVTVTMCSDETVR